jgi:hypothetical protein
MAGFIAPTSHDNFTLEEFRQMLFIGIVMPAYAV